MLASLEKSLAVSPSLVNIEHPLPFRVLLNQLNFFEAELWRHAWIEDKVLLPKALFIEEKLKLYLLRAKVV